MVKVPGILPHPFILSGLDNIAVDSSLKGLSFNPRIMPSVLNFRNNHLPFCKVETKYFRFVKHSFNWISYKKTESETNVMPLNNLYHLYSLKWYFIYNMQSSFILTGSQLPKDFLVRTWSGVSTVDFRSHNCGGYFLHFNFILGWMWNKLSSTNNFQDVLS